MCADFLAKTAACAPALAKTAACARRRMPSELFLPSAPHKDIKIRRINQVARGNRPNKLIVEPNFERSHSEASIFAVFETATSQLAGCADPPYSRTTIPWLSRNVRLKTRASATARWVNGLGVGPSTDKDGPLGQPQQPIKTNKQLKKRNPKGSQLHSLRQERISAPAPARADQRARPDESQGNTERVDERFTWSARIRERRAGIVANLDHGGI